jgi:hypothetical protein
MLVALRTQGSVLTLLLHCCHTVVTPLLHCCCTVVTLLLHCRYTVVTLLSHYCYTVVPLLLHCCSTIDSAGEMLSPYKAEPIFDRVNNFIHTHPYRTYNIRTLLHSTLLTPGSAHFSSITEGTGYARMCVNLNVCEVCVLCVYVCVSVLVYVSGYLYMCVCA